MTDFNALPELHEGDHGHIDAHNTIRSILCDHEARLRDLGVRISRLEPRPWLPEDPDNHAGQRPLLPEDPRQAPELPEQPPMRQDPELPEQPPAVQRQPRQGR
ncbi:hypothetical protein E1161_13375 [Saccharopolyspora aridisoli]|uniref:Uncharacterized protein n=1 Tax=Saccharopolyspora aridisoli TaxID=2530385 RepID=A0A4R4UZU1_9PSEU|nr:hypothetical protein [Saccharopolyspora aridisoli]TDC92359.1 hypothetical protein E1161_13375 [Saccharopolyspora aridisoli]